MTALLKKNVKFTWEEVEEKAFVELKEGLINASTLSFPDTDRPFKLYTDASEEACGCCLTQDYGGEVGEKPVGY